MPARRNQNTPPIGPVLRILTNGLDATAQEIADLYKRRWTVELFFRWVKQTLKITRCLGSSEKAVRIQVACALIAFLLLRAAKAGQAAVTSPLAFARLVRDSLMHLRTLGNLAKPPQRAPPKTATTASQGTLFATWEQHQEMCRTAVHQARPASLN